MSDETPIDEPETAIPFRARYVDITVVHRRNGFVEFRCGEDYLAEPEADFDAHYIPVFVGGAAVIGGSVG